MRLIETCTCGASIEVIWSEPDGQYDSKGKRESKRSEDELEQLETYGSWLREIVSLHHEGGDGAHVCHYAVLAQKALDGVPFPASEPAA